jgi:hypothetical protein
LIEVGKCTDDVHEMGDTMEEEEEAGLGEVGDVMLYIPIAEFITASRNLAIGSASLMTGQMPMSLPKEPRRGGMPNF